MARTHQVSKGQVSKSVAPEAPKAEAPVETPKAEQPAAAEQPKVVALRGGLAVATVKLAGKKYATKAPHNLEWWGSIAKACEGDKAASVADLTKAAKDGGAGVPTHFIGYCIRRGYLADGTAVKQ